MRARSLSCAPRAEFSGGRLDRAIGVIRRQRGGGLLNTPSSLQRVKRLSIVL